jgi:hypothetical protein
VGVEGKNWEVNAVNWTSNNQVNILNMFNQKSLTAAATRCFIFNIYLYISIIHLFIWLEIIKVLNVSTLFKKIPWKLRLA